MPNKNDHFLAQSFVNTYQTKFKIKDMIFSPHLEHFPVCPIVDMARQGDIKTSYNKKISNW